MSRNTGDVYTIILTAESPSFPTVGEDLNTAFRKLIRLLYPPQDPSKEDEITDSHIIRYQSDGSDGSLYTFKVWRSGHSYLSATAYKSKIMATATDVRGPDIPVAEIGKVFAELCNKKDGIEITCQIISPFDEETISAAFSSVSRARKGSGTYNQ